MNTPALPAYLQNRQSQGVAARATSGMGGVMPPHISIRGNSFTLVDATGNQQPVGPTLDACVVDLSDQMNKRYYENDWTPGSDEPPTCWSSNGIGPSRESAKPQAPTCAQCQWNVRGSDTSKISGKPIKACRDELFLALLIPQYPNMLFQLVVPPGSFKNWQAFNAPFSKGGADPSDVLIRFGFQPQVNGVMTFQAMSYIGEGTYTAREQALTQKATDVLVGRNDVPIAITHQPAVNMGGQHSVVDQQSAGQAPLLATGALGTGVMQGAAQSNAAFGGAPQGQVTPMSTAGVPSPAYNTQPQVQQSAPAFGGAPQAPFGAPAAAMTTQLQGNAQPAATPQTEPPKTRTRRTQAQIAADNAAKAAAQAGAAIPPGSSAPVQPAPFPVNQPQGAFAGVMPATGFGPGAGQPAAGTQFGAGQATAAAAQVTPQFGIAPGADPNADPQLQAMLATLGNG